MSQPLTVAHRGGQLAYPTWTAHTTNCRASLVDGAGRCEDARQAGQGLSGLTLHIQHVSIRSPVAHPLDKEWIDTQVVCERCTTTSETVTRVHRGINTVLAQATVTCSLKPYVSRPSCLSSLPSPQVWVGGRKRIAAERSFAKQCELRWKLVTK